MSKNINMSSWFFNQNFNGVTEDFFHDESLGFDDALKLFDFPLEPVEESNSVVENWDAEFKGLELPPPDALASLSSTFNPQGCNESKKVFASTKVSQLKQLPKVLERTGARSSHHRSTKGSPCVFRTSSPVSVLESNTSSSNSNSSTTVGRPAPFDSKLVVPVKRRSKRPRSTIPVAVDIYTDHNIERIFNSDKRKGERKKEAIRKCTHCKETKTPQWREGPMGPRTLCNACGVRYKKASLHSGSKEGEDFRPGAIRKCTHCEATKTPQWREGPMGPRTLCNACGVRYRSGRLFPEYRPLSSPTYVESLHSNSHKKVAELRKKATTHEGGVKG